MEFIYFFNLGSEIDEGSIVPSLVFSSFFSMSYFYSLSVSDLE